MPVRFDPAVWRARALAALAQLALIFVGVTLAFVFEGWRKEIDEAAETRQTVKSLMSELGHYEERGLFHAERFEQSIVALREAERAGRREPLLLYRLPGALRPPAAAWEAAVSSGVANRIDPALRLEIGWLYSELVGVHENYRRQVEFAEREVMPRALQGADGFYGPDGRLLPQFQVHIALVAEFAQDVKRLSAKAGELKRKLEATQR